jgi:hypothetical protein
MTLYRASVINLCDNEDYLISQIELHLETFNVIRETQCFFIIKVKGKERKIGKKSIRAFAATSKEKALMDAWHRNSTYKGILRAKLHYADRVGKFLKEQIDAP